MSEGTELATLLTDFFDLEGYVYLGLLLVSATASFVVIRVFLIRLIYKAMGRTKTKWDDILVSKGVFRQLAYLAPAVVLYFGVAFYPSITPISRQFILAYVGVNVVIILDRLLSAGLDIYRLYPVSKKRPIKGYVQLAKLLAYILGAVVVISLLLGKSPWGILGGISAMSAVLIFVFRNTILSLIASIQLIANDLIHEGDFIEVSDYDASGDVIDIALHTIKVRNWDNTIVTVPTYKLIEGSFKNWRGVFDKGARRIMRSLLIDQTSVRFCDDELFEKFLRIHRLKPYLEGKQKELNQATSQLDTKDDDQHPLNRRALTNLGTFRAYVTAYLNENANIRKDMGIMVRQRAPSPYGLPLEIYIYSSDTAWANYEGIQADIFDHLIAALRYFDLRVFQYPTGLDLRVPRPGYVDLDALPSMPDAVSDIATAVRHDNASKSDRAE